MDLTMPSQPSNHKPKHSVQFEAIGTQWLIETAQPLGALQQQIMQRIDEFDHTYSRFRDDSLVAQIAANAGRYEFPGDARQLIDFYQKLYEATDGAVSPLVGNILETVGYDKTYSLSGGSPQPALAWGDAMTWRGGELTTTAPVLLDFGAAGKGYLVDLVAELLEQHGHGDYVIDASGDVRVRGTRETIGLENPTDTTMVIGTAGVENASLCASATNRRTWGEWHHVIDPRTAQPVRDVLATWVIAPTTMVADGLATALFFVPATKLSQWEFTYVRLLADGTVERSPDFVGELYI